MRVTGAGAAQFPILISQGGTGQTTAAAALAALGGVGPGSHTVKRGTGTGAITFNHTSLTAIDAAHLDITVTVPVGMLAIALLFISASPGNGNTLQIGIAVDGVVAYVATGAAVTGNNLPYTCIAVLVGDGSSHVFEPQGICSASVNAAIANDTAQDAPLHLVTIIPAT